MKRKHTTMRQLGLISCILLIISLTFGCATLLRPFRYKVDHASPEKEQISRILEPSFNETLIYFIRPNEITGGARGITVLINGEVVDILEMKSFTYAKIPSGEQKITAVFTNGYGVAMWENRPFQDLWRAREKFDFKYFGRSKILTWRPSSEYYLLKDRNNKIGGLGVEISSQPEAISFYRRNNKVPFSFNIKSSPQKTLTITNSLIGVNNIRSEIDGFDLSTKGGETIFIWVEGHAMKKFSGGNIIFKILTETKGRKLIKKFPLMDGLDDTVDWKLLYPIRKVVNSLIK